jgi:hypothetical protein
MTGTPRAPWTSEEDKKLRALVLSANSVDTIAEALNRTHFCRPSQSKHPEADIEKDCDASQNDLIELGAEQMGILESEAPRDRAGQKAG